MAEQMVGRERYPPMKRTEDTTRVIINEESTCQYGPLEKL